jgi:hypothetical protein
MDLKMKTFADIKRKLIEGNSITMLRHDYGHCDLIGLDRKVIKRQTNAVQFEGGSWLRLDKPASNYIPTSENTFLVRLNQDQFMEYRIN